MRRSLVLTLLLIGLGWFACGPAPETTKLPTPTVVSTKEGLCELGRKFHREQMYDSAEVYFNRSYALDSSYLVPLNELGQMHYALGIQQPGEKNPRRFEHFKKSYACFAKLESQGSNDSELLERLGELSSAFDDKKALVKYAKKNAEVYPYDRQYFNLGYAYFQVDDYQNVIKTQKEAIGKFKGSTYVGSFYRQLGRAYMKIDRDQTAERTFDSGLKAVDVVVAERKKEGGNFAATEDCRRLADDKIGMLVSLKSLHQTYRANDKLQKVEQQLKELGYEK